MKFITSMFCFVLALLFCGWSVQGAHTSCAGRCDSRTNKRISCQCNSLCTRFSDCCDDYTTICTPTKCSSTEVVSEEMWRSDVNMFTSQQVKVDLQSNVSDHERVDHAPHRLFSYVNQTKLATGTYALFRALLNNYNPVKGQGDVPNLMERYEENMFLSAILKTRVMGVLFNYSKCRGWVKDMSSFESKLITAWFTPYSRSSRGILRDSSGFEHIMVGEFKNNRTVNGFHNWLSFYDKERSGEINYNGYVTENSPFLIGAAFSWDNRFKDLGSFIIGISPELDMALYSLAFWNAPGGLTKVSLGGMPANIQTYATRGHIATAFIFV